MAALSFYSLTVSVRSAAYRLESVTLSLTMKLKKFVRKLYVSVLYMVYTSFTN